MTAMENRIADADMQTILSAWNDATERLRQTHETLRDEVRRLTDELEIKNRELARKNRLADLGQMASHVAHEVRNSLVPMKLYLSLLDRRLSDDAGSQDIFEKISAGFVALEATVSDLLNFSAERDPQRRHPGRGVPDPPVPVLHTQDPMTASAGGELAERFAPTGLDLGAVAP